MEFETDEDANYMMNAFDKLLSNRRLSNTTPEKVISTNMITFTHPEIYTTLFNLGTTIIWVENVPNPTVIAELFVSEALAKSSSTQENYSTLSKGDKWNLLRHIVENQFPLKERLSKCYVN